jgi:hypothetical protein
MSPVTIGHFSLRQFLFAIIMVATCALSARAIGQTIYKCGSTYSQAPCPGGVAVDAADSRSGTQKKEADLATAKGAKAADTLAKERIAQEAADRANRANAATVIGAKAEPPASNEAPVKKGAKKRKKKPEAEYFTAKTPGDGKASKAKKASKPAN